MTQGVTQSEAEGLAFGAWEVESNMHFPNRLEVSGMQPKPSPGPPPRLSRTGVLSLLPTGEPRHSFHTDSPSPTTILSGLGQSMWSQGLYSKSRSGSNSGLSPRNCGEFSRTVRSHPIRHSPTPFPHPCCKYLSSWTQTGSEGQA